MKLGTLRDGKSSVAFEVDPELLLVTTTREGGRPACISYPTGMYAGVTPEIVGCIEMARYRARGFRVYGEGDVEMFMTSAGADWEVIQSKAEQLAAAFGCRCVRIEAAGIVAIWSAGALERSDVLVIGNPGEQFCSRLDHPDVSRVAAALALAHPKHLSLAFDAGPVPSSLLEAMLAKRTIEQLRTLIACGTYQTVNLDALAADLAETAEEIAPF